MNEIRVTVFARGEGAGGKYYMKYVDPRTGKQVRKATGTKVRRDAERMAAKWEQELRDGTARTYGNMPWDEFRERYGQEVLRSLADKTEEKVEGVFNVLEDLVNPKRLSDVNEDSLSEYQRTLRDMGRAELTIKGHLCHIRAALRWAVDQKWLATVPTIKMPKRAKGTDIAKGRPITLEEFEVMLLKVPSVVAKGIQPPEREPAVVESWRFLMRGLWWSGLRLAEALELHWTDQEKLCPIDLDTRRPLLSIPGTLEKGHRDRLMPMAPEFARFLQAVPERQRIGYVFDPQGRYDSTARLSAQYIGKRISKVGQAAGIVVSEKRGKRKYASAHDFRRSFGQRWAQILLPQQLKELMRHSDIATTMTFYALRNARATADVLWSQFESRENAEAGAGTIFGTSEKAQVTKPLDL